MADMEIDDDDVDTTAEDDGTSATVANVNKAAKPDIETKEKGDGDDEDDRYDILLREKEDEEEKFIDDVIDAEAAAIPEDELGEVIGSSGNTNEEKSKKMRSVYVEDPNGDLVHKRTLLKIINSGRALRKSMDRAKRVRGDARHGNGKESADSCVKKAYKFAHDRTDFDSGANLHSIGDFCCVLVESTEGSSKNAHMVVGKLQRFGEGNCSNPLHLSWPIEKATFKAYVQVINVDAYSNIDGDLCLRPTGEIILTLMNVPSYCITPITPSLEESEVDGESVTNALMKLSELKTVFVEMTSAGTRCHKLKKTIVLPPITVNSESPFIVTNKVSNLPVCGICRPPMTIGKPNSEKHEVQRYLRNHAASHFWKSPTVEEPCALCYKNGCSIRLSVSIGKSDVQKILNMGKNAKIPPGAVVYHGCQTYPEVEPFEFKWCKKIVGFPCRNMPVLCHACTTDPNIPTFLWSYNIENHYKEHHNTFSEDDKKKYEGLLSSCMTEKRELEALFPINEN
uniref:Uncharacterized protein n=1 Tax=Skeletonema marinoi TaxID=267567 RepID=A0A7S2L7F9_9STRA